MQDKVFVTIVSNNYFARALALVKSLRHCNPDIPVYIGLADGRSDIINYKSDDFQMIYLEELQDAVIGQMKFKYDIVEFNTAIKPFVIKKLIADGYKKIVYLDPDIYVYRDLDCLFDLLNRYSILLTPHRCFPLISSNQETGTRETNVSAAGVFNLGFCAFSASEIGIKIIDWWCNKLQDYCYVDHRYGLFYDQKWMNFIPCFCPNDVCILREPGFNFAYWNFDERTLMVRDGNYEAVDIGGTSSPLYFFHFSGFDPYCSDYIDVKHFNTSELGDQSVTFFRKYADEVISMGHGEFINITYAYSQYENGDHVTTLHRQLFRALIDDGKEYSNPFSTEKGSFYSLMKKSKLLSNEKEILKKDHMPNFESKAKKVNALLKAIKKMLGVNRYMMLMRYMAYASRPDQQTFLLKNEK